MARQLSSIPNIDISDPTGFPAGRIQDEDPPTEGTPVTEGLYGDIVQFFHKLMRLAGITYNDAAENETVGFQFVDALKAYIRSTAASQTEKGAIEIATEAEAKADVSFTLAITPYTLARRTATLGRAGVAKVSSDAQAAEGTDDTTIITPAKNAVANALVVTTIPDDTPTILGTQIGLIIVDGVNSSVVTLPPHKAGLKRELLVITQNYTGGTGDEVVITDGTNSKTLDFGTATWRFISNGSKWSYEKSTSYTDL